MYRALITLAAAVVFAGSLALYALAGHQPGSVASITGCLTSTGKLVKLKVGDVPKSACGGQTEVHLSGGDITAALPTPGGGLAGGGTNGEALLGLGNGFKLPQGCNVGAVAKRSGPTDWVCATDNDTQYDGTDFALSDQSCATGAVVTGISATGTLVCGRQIRSANGQHVLNVADTSITLSSPFATLRVQAPGEVSISSDSFDVLTEAPQGGFIRLVNASAGQVLVFPSDGSVELSSAHTIDLLADAVSLGGTSCPAAARRGDGVVVNPQNGVGSIVTGSTKVFAC